MVIIFAGALLFGQASSPASQPAELPLFGERHQIVTSVALGVTGSYTGRSNGTSNYDLTLTPAADYFVLRHLSLGAEISGGIAGQRGGTVSTDTLSTSIAPRVGYVITLANRLALWPRLIVGGTYLWEAGTTNVAAFEVWGQLSLPLVVTLAPHVFWGIGPYFSAGTDLLRYPGVSYVTNDSSGATVASTNVPPSWTSIQYLKVGLATHVGGYF